MFEVIISALEDLCIVRLPNITKIWDKQVITGLEESEDANNCSIFPLLRKVLLVDLENLNAFCGNS
uniref:hypothetical protein n=1 Tax=Salmonella sp. s57610 TaxID=3159697 RepID=UPI00398130B2